MMPSPLNLRARVAAALTPSPAVDLGAGVRADSTNPTAGQAGGAGIANQINNLGTVRDAGTAGRPNLTRQFLSERELISLFRSGVFKRICEIYPAWATRKGWHVVDDSDEPNPLADEMQRFDVAAKFRQADTWARVFGAGYIFMVTHDSGATLADPLDPSSVTALKALHVLDGREVTPVSWDNDPESETWGDVLTYAVTPIRPGISTGAQTIHASRLLRFRGDRLPPSARAQNNKWIDDSVGQVIWDALRNMAQTSTGGARLAQELSLLVFKIDPAKAAGEARNKLFGTLRLMNLQKSIANAMVVGRDGEVSRLNATTSGFGELSADAQRQLALVTGIPLALLFGEAPAGLNADGESWWRMWRNAVADYQHFRYLPELRRLAEVMYYDAGIEPPEGWSVEFRSLGEMSEKERAEVRLLTAQADQIDIMSGVLDPHRVATSRYGGNTYAFELQPPTDDDTDDDLTDPDLLARAKAELDKTLGLEE